MASRRPRRGQATGLLAVFGLALLLHGPPARADVELDKSFGEHGQTRFGLTGSEIGGVAVDGANRPLIASWLKPKGVPAETAVTRLTRGGTIDERFGQSETTSRALRRKARDIEVAADGGSLFVSLGNQHRSRIVAIGADGELDGSWGTNGTASLGLGVAQLAVQPDGGLIAAGVPGERTLVPGAPPAAVIVSVVRFKPNGKRDQSFGSGGVYFHSSPCSGGADTLECPFGRLADAEANDDGEIVMAGSITNRCGPDCNESHSMTIEVSPDGQSGEVSSPPGGTCAPYGWASAVAFAGDEPLVAGYCSFRGPFLRFGADPAITPPKSLQPTAIVLPDPDSAYLFGRAGARVALTEVTRLGDVHTVHRFRSPDRSSATHAATHDGGILVIIAGPEGAPAIVRLEESPPG